MVGQTVPLNTTASITLNSSGAGTATVGPISLYQVWQVNNVAVSCATQVKESQAVLYFGPAGGTELGSTNTGSSGDSTSLDVMLRAGNVLTVVWSGGDANTRATISVYGTMTIGR